MEITTARIIFLIVALFTLGSGIMVVSTGNLIHAALWLVSALFGVAVLYALLNAAFLAVVQVVVYIGAIAILFIFAVMLTRKEIRDRGPQLNQGWWLSAVLAVLTFGGLAGMLWGWDGMVREAPALPEFYDQMSELGTALIDPNFFVLPFEVASVLLLAALVGAVYIAFNRK
jgi:NADH-quinone oxidoreductase subunit J